MLTRVNDSAVSMGALHACAHGTIRRSVVLASSSDVLQQGWTTAQDPVMTPSAPPPARHRCMAAQQEGHHAHTHAEL